MAKGGDTGELDVRSSSMLLERSKAMERSIAGITEQLKMGMGRIEQRLTKLEAKKV
jgi:hypothetical protein